MVFKVGGFQIHLAAGRGSHEVEEKQKTGRVDEWGRSSIAPAEQNPYDLDLRIMKGSSNDGELGPASHGCTVNATCEGCVQTDNCGHSHYCATNNRCGHTDGCND